MAVESNAPDIERLRAHYEALVVAHGDAPAGAQWRDRATQDARLQQLLRIADLGSASVLDVGCGTGRLFELLRAQGYRGDYLGIDLAPSAIKLARQRFPDARFEVRDVLAESLPQRFDYAMLSGIFNNRLTDNWAFLTAVLGRVYAQVDRGLAFNALSTYVDYRDEGLWYVQPERVFALCKTELSPWVSLHNDYAVRPGAPPFEFTIHVRRAALGVAD